MTTSTTNSKPKRWEGLTDFLWILQQIMLLVIVIDNVKAFVDHRLESILVILAVICNCGCAFGNFIFDTKDDPFKEFILWNGLELWDWFLMAEGIAYYSFFGFMQNGITEKTMRPFLEFLLFCFLSLLQNYLQILSSRSVLMSYPIEIASVLHRDFSVLLGFYLHISYDFSNQITDETLLTWKSEIEQILNSDQTIEGKKIGFVKKMLVKKILRAIDGRVKKTSTSEKDSESFPKEAKKTRISAPDLDYSSVTSSDYHPNVSNSSGEQLLDNAYICLIHANRLNMLLRIRKSSK